MMFRYYNVKVHESKIFGHLGAAEKAENAKLTFYHPINM